MTADGQAKTKKNASKKLNVWPKAVAVQYLDSSVINSDVWRRVDATS